MPDVKLSTIIERLEALDTVPLPGGELNTALDLAYALREILTVGGDVDRYLFGKEADAVLILLNDGGIQTSEPNLQTMPRRSATLTVDGEKPRVTVDGTDFERGWTMMKGGITQELAEFGVMDKRPAGIMVSRDLANAIGEKMGAPHKLGPGEAAAVHYEGITVIVSGKIFGFGWEWIW